MGICFEGLRSGPVCLGSVFAQVSGGEVGLAHAAIAVGLLVVAIVVFVFRNPA